MRVDKPAMSQQTVHALACLNGVLTRLPGTTAPWKGPDLMSLAVAHGLFLSSLTQQHQVCLPLTGD